MRVCLRDGFAMIHPSEAAGHTDYQQLAARLGREVLERRILKQAGLWAREVHQGRGFFKLESMIPIDEILSFMLKLTGVAEIGRRNYLDVRIVSNDVVLPGLPAAFEGFRLLHLSDLHCDLEPALMDVIIERLGGHAYDAVVLTGDYHNQIGETHDFSLELMGKLVPHLHEPRLAVLGNHDFIEKVAFLEDAGLKVLLNETERIERDGASLWICGVDDPHFFGTHDLEKVRAQVPAGETAILLSHSPETYRQAEALGFALMLSGHTHGGQCCLPGGFALVKNAPVPRRMLAGSWQYGSLAGYTSRGTGGCGVAARFFCPAEMTIHTLKRAP